MVFQADGPREEETLRLIGVVSDTHGLLRLEAIRAFQGCHLILHAGDIGAPGILENLQILTPVIVIKGNNDKGS